MAERPGPVYLDHAATTPMRPEAVAAMTPFLAGGFGNPSGTHAVARAATRALDEAREEIAALLGARPGEVVLTAGGTEADHLGVQGAARAARAAGAGDGVVTSAFEHKAVLAASARLADEGFRVARAPVGADGLLDLDALAAQLDERTVVVSVMLVNNEVGTVQPLAEVAELVASRAPRAVLHTDAVQAVPWLDVAAAAAPAPLVAVSAHKFGGPKGTGALVVRDGVALQPLVEGGGQERGRRAGTVNVAGAVAMAAALRTTVECREREVAAARRRRDRLETGLVAAIGTAIGTGGSGVRVHGDPRSRVAGTCHVAFPGVEAETLLVALDRAGVCAAAGSSCSSGAAEPSHVLTAMGLDDDEVRSSVRFSLGWSSTDQEIERALAVIPETVEGLRVAGALR